MKKKDQNIVYWVLAGIATWYLINKYKKIKSNPVAETEVILNQPNLETPAEQVSATVETAPAPAYNVKYKLSGVKYKLPQTL